MAPSARNPLLVLALALVAGAVLVRPSDAQTIAPIRVEGVGEPVSAGVGSHRGYPAYPAWTLRALGARVDATTRGLAVVFGADTIRFDAGSPYFRVGDRSWQLVSAPYREGGVFYLPHQWFAEWLPRAYPDQVTFRDGRLALQGAAVADGGADPEPSRAGESGGSDGSATSAAGGAGDTEPLGKPAPVPLVVIDAGHGGRDPGRTGPSGLKEKDVVLQVSKRLARELAQRGYEVRMTRTTDTLIGLYDRAPMANEWRGNRPGLFLSIHANGVSNRRVTGFETFFLSDARTEDERRVAEMENAAIEYELEERVVPTDDLGLMFNSLRNEFYIRASNSLAGMVQDEFRAFHPGHNRGVKQAGFVVLVGAFMPAVLIELAFISNPSEERLLGSGRFQVDVADGIADAVDRFFASQGDLWQGGTR
jgi:N-acetylmuramoyl-L-alanine amidase